MLTDYFSRAAKLRASTREELLANRHLPQQHRRKLRSPKLLERVNIGAVGVIGSAVIKGCISGLRASS